MRPEDIEKLIKTGLPEAEIRVTGDDGAHFEAVVIAAAFAGKTAVKQHQMVYAALGQAMESDIHALSLQTYTPEAWAARAV